MKRLFSFLITLAFISGMVTSASAQKPRQQWHTKSWAKQINEMHTYEVDGKNYLFMLNDSKGRAWIYGLNEDGTMGKRLWETDGWFPGIEVAATYDIDGKDFLLMVHPEKQVLWIFELAAGKVVKTLLETKAPEKGIKEAATYQDETGTYVFLSNSIDGHAWIMELKPDGTLGDVTWSTTSWKKGIIAADTYKTIEDKHFLVLSRPSRGDAWIFELLPGGKVGENTHHRSWHAGMTALTIIETAGKNYAMLSRSTEGQFWSYRLSNDGKFDKDVFYTKNYAKGIDELTSYDANGVDFVILGRPSAGWCWIYSNYHRLPSIKQSGQKVTGDRPQALKNLDQMFENVSSSQKIVAELCDKLIKTKNTVGNVNKVKNTVGSLENKASNIAEVLGTFNAIPMIGTLTRVLSRALDKSADILNGIEKTLAGLNKGAIEPTRGSIDEAWDDVNALEISLQAVSIKFAELKVNEQKFLTAMKDQTKRDQFMKFANAVNEEIKKMNSEVQDVNNQINNIMKVNHPVGDFNKKIKKVDKAVDKADNVAGKVDKVLSKKFKKKIFRKTISVSLKDVLTGGGLAKKVKRFTKKWTKKLLNPVLKKLKVKIPGVPGADKIVKAMDKVKKTAKDMVNKSSGLKQSSEKLIKLNAQFGAAF